MATSAGGAEHTQVYHDGEHAEHAHSVHSRLRANSAIMDMKKILGTEAILQLCEVYAQEQNQED